MSTVNNARAVSITLYLGLVLTVIATVVPFVGAPVGELISAYVKAGYPAASTSEISTATTIYLVGLALVGICGVVLWGIAIAATRAGKRWTPWFVTSAMVVGIAVGLFDLMVRDTNGETGLPALVGWLGLAPSAAGVLAVALLWMKPAAPRPMPGHPSY